MSLLTLCQAAARRINIPVPATIVSNTDESAALLLGLATEEGVALMRRYDWQALITEHSFLTTAADAQVGAIPSDYDRMLPESMYNRSRRRPVAGPLSSDEWQQTKATLITWVNPTYRIRGNALLLSPTPPAGETVAYEYISKNFCASGIGAAQADWEADSDVARLDEGLMTLGLIWRFKQVKGLAYGEDIQLYERRVTDAELRDGTKPRLSSAPGLLDRPATPLQVPETWVIP